MYIIITFILALWQSCVLSTVVLINEYDDDDFDMRRVFTQFMNRAEEAEKKVQELRSDVSIILL